MYVIQLGKLQPKEAEKEIYENVVLPYATARNFSIQLTLRTSWRHTRKAPLFIL